MNNTYPIYTGITDCQDCYKCVRNCPVKAIHIREGKASVIPEDCIMCGTCVEVCPSGAKKIRDDVERVKQLLRFKDRVIVSLAPSYINEFDHVSRSQMILALKKLGFWGVSETALGAQEVSSHIAIQLSEAKGGIFLSSACPSAVELVRKHYSEFHDAVTTLKSPMQAHAAMLKRTYGENITVVFIGPCISKKDESDTHPELVAAAITFQGLDKWLKQEKINPLLMESDPSVKFIPESAREGSLYPVEGGMIAGIKAECAVHDSAFMSFSGVSDIHMALNGLEEFKPDHPVFIELLACKGGCINGPARLNKKSTVLKRYAILEDSNYSIKEFPRTPKENIREVYPRIATVKNNFDELDIKKALQEVGKYTKEDELNCSGCGYNSCRDFAVALLDGRAEREMCVTHMRKLAQKKANALLRAIPSGVVIVNDQLKIVECNRKFSHLLGQVEESIYDAKPGMEGARLDKILPFHHYFRAVLENGEDILDKDIRFDKRILHGSIFTIEKHRIVGGVFQDITTPAMQKEHIIDKTRDVIEKNLETVQKIAYLLGENASETQVVLDSIINSFSADISTKKKMTNHKPFVEIDYTQINKKNQLVCGDAFLSKKIKSDKRVISVLSDGLGSGVKANVLSGMTATMALNYMVHNYDLKKTARAIMQTLPVCSVRKISYATFTIVDVDHNGFVNLIEYGNPVALIIRNGKRIVPDRHQYELNKMDQLHDKMYYSQFQAELHDRIILMSDGITQSGLGPKLYPFGWGDENVSNYVCDIVAKNPSVSARYLSKLICDKALENDNKTPYDDTSCGVISFREPRETLLISGPPIYRENDAAMADAFRSFKGKKIICGGTTANIIARETNEKIKVDLQNYDKDIPTTSIMNGVDLITEGSITLGKVLQLLEDGTNPETLPRHGAALLIDHLLNSDKIHFLIGTKINEAHQDPNVPVELEIRRSLVKQIIRLLEDKYLKETELKFI